MEDKLKKRLQRNKNIITKKGRRHLKIEENGRRPQKKNGRQPKKK
jgi:hypothetical protein